MSDDTTRKRLIAVAENFVAGTQSRGYRCDIALGRQHLREAMWTFKARVCGSEALLRKQRRKQPVLCCAPVDETFRHRAGHFAGAGCLCAREPQCMRRLLLVELHGARGSGCRSEDTGRAGDIPM